MSLHRKTKHTDKLKDCISPRKNIKAPLQTVAEIKHLVSLFTFESWNEPRIFCRCCFLSCYVESGCEEWAVLSLSNAWDNHLTPLFYCIDGQWETKASFFSLANSSEGDAASKSCVRPIFVSNVGDHRIKRKYPLLLLLHVCFQWNH